MISVEKNFFREKVREIKKNYSEEELIKKSEKIFENVNSLEIIQKSNCIMSFWSIPYEVYTHSWNNQMLKKGKTILLPSINGNDLIPKVYKGENFLKEVPPFNIKEPVGPPFTKLNEIEVIIVPGVAFDITGNRLGRGKGYYDRFLKKINSLKIGVSFSFTIFNKIPATENDVKMDYIISENSIIKIKV